MPNDDRCRADAAIGAIDPRDAAPHRVTPLPTAIRKDTEASLCPARACLIGHPLVGGGVSIFSDIFIFYFFFWKVHVCACAEPAAASRVRRRPREKLVSSFTVTGCGPRMVAPGSPD